MGQKEALLTTTQREFLTGELTYDGDYAKQQRYQRRRAIEERVRAGILVDIPLLEDEFRDGVIDAADVVDDVDLTELGDALRSQVALACQLAQAAGLDPDYIVDAGRTSRAEVLLKEFQDDPHELSLEELEFLYTEGMIDVDTYRETLREAIPEPLVGMESPEDLDQFLDEPDRE